MENFRMPFYRLSPHLETWKPVVKMVYMLSIVMVVLEICGRIYAMKHTHVYIYIYIFIHGYMNICMGMGSREEGGRRKEDDHYTYYAYYDVYDYYDHFDYDD